MDTVILVLLTLLVLGNLLHILLLMRRPKETFLQRVLTEQILESRRLTNLLVTQSQPQNFHAVSAMNPEIQGTSPLKPAPDHWVSEDGRDSSEVYLDFGDEGFDELPGNSGKIIPK